MSHDPHRLSKKEYARLVAYLDGELGEMESQAISDQLVQSEQARRELKALEQTWELLDLLPQPEPTPERIGRPLNEVRPIPLTTNASIFQWVVWALTAILLLGIGFELGLVTIRWLGSDPSSRLIRELSLAEHLDAYRALDSLDDLQRLMILPMADEP